MASENVVTLTTQNFDSDVLNSDLPVLVDFWAVWCGPCKAIAPLLDQVADDQAGNLVVGKLDVDKEMAIARKYGIRNIPSLLVFKGGEVVSKHVGALNASKLNALLAEHI
ncbi:MAG: thioredoxin [Deltaproteobacteria bacterium]|nr:thioredoxin [Deltaproteobacteria bacterium]HCH66235.1 thioredoxin [Deltaproteobacteria bacterium]